MTEQLPITIYVSDELKNQCYSIGSITNKLAAQFNFQAMTANWYGDEDNIPFIQLLLHTPEKFAGEKENQQRVQTATFKAHSDDVFSFTDANAPPQIIYTIAITEQELTLVAQKPKILAGLLRVKLQKVLNIVAQQLTLQTI